MQRAGENCIKIYRDFRRDWGQFYKLSLTSLCKKLMKHFNILSRYYDFSLIMCYSKRNRKDQTVCVSLPKGSHPCNLLSAQLPPPLSSPHRRRSLPYSINRSSALSRYFHWTGIQSPKIIRPSGVLVVINLPEPGGCNGGTLSRDLQSAFHPFHSHPQTTLQSRLFLERRCETELSPREPN